MHRRFPPVGGLLLLSLLLPGAVFAQENLAKIFVPTTLPDLPRVEFVYRLPATPVSSDAAVPVLVLFGGRNWPGETTMARYGFEPLADRFGAVLVSPTYRDHDYWEPAAWSGAALQTALESIRTEHGIAAWRVYYYGYSAGAQCANLFYAWNPQEVCGVGLHACGVWSDDVTAGSPSIPLLVTCGEADLERFRLSYTAVQQRREAGRLVVFKNYPTGHELNHDALRLAQSFFADLLSGENKPVVLSADFSDTVYPAGSREASRIDPEFRNPFLSQETAQCWRGTGREHAP